MKEKRPNTSLRRERELRGWSQRTVAERIGTDEPGVCRWEKGYHKPSRYFQTKLCELFEKSAEELGFMDVPMAKEDKTHSLVASIPTFEQQVNINLNASDTINQASIEGFLKEQYMKQNDSVSFSSFTEPTLTHLLNIEVFQQISNLLNTSPITLQYLDEYTVTLWKHRTKATYSIEVLYLQVISHLEKTKGLLAYALLPAERLRLCDIIGRVTLLAGVLLYDVGLYSQARQVIQIALQAAREADNPTLQAIAWTWMSFAWTYTKFISFALPCILEANALITPSSDKRVKAWVAAVRAEVHARLDQRDECLYALSQADQDYGNPVEEIHYLFGFDAVLLDGYKGVCLQCFYRKQDSNTYSYLQEAKKALERALASNAPARRKLYYLGDFALIEARQGEVEAACTYVTQSITSMGQVESKSIWRRLTDVRQLLQPYENSPYVKALDAQMPLLLPSK